MPILTIAIPTYNSSKYLKETLEKTIIQCGKNNEIEILVSDNCSTDDTEAVVKDFINKGINIRYLKNSQNVGPDKNVINCINNANGDFVHTLCDDDYYTDDAVDRILRVIKNNQDLDLILLSNNYLNVATDKIIGNIGQEKDKIAIGAEEFVKNSELKELCLTNCIFKTEKFKKCNIEKYEGKQWPHIGMLVSALDKNFKTYIFSFANPVVTIRFGNQRWATEGGAIGYFYNVIKIYKDLCKKGYQNEYFIIKNLFISKIINPLTMKYDSSMLNLKYALLFLPIYSWQIREYFKFVKALVFTKRQAFSGGGS